jgi:hypothetical protein
MYGGTGVDIIVAPKKRLPSSLPSESNINLYHELRRMRAEKRGKRLESTPSAYKAASFRRGSMDSQLKR